MMVQRFVADKISEKLNLLEYWFSELFWKMLPDRMYKSQEKGGQGPLSRRPMSEDLRSHVTGQVLEC